MSKDQSIIKPQAIELKDTSLESASWFDIAAHSYREIYRSGVPEQEFLACYCIPASAGSKHPENPNLLILSALENDVFALVSQELQDDLDRPDAIRALLRRYSTIELQPYEDRKLNSLAPLWAIVLGIDRAYRDSPYFSRHVKRGPLNTALIDEVGVYFSPAPNPFEFAQDSLDLKRIPECSINNQLAALLFYRRRGQTPLPRIVASLTRDDDLLPTAKLLAAEPVRELGGGMSLPSDTLVVPATSALPPSPAKNDPLIRIAVCSFSGVVLHGFEAPQLPVSFEFEGGISFGVSYSADCETRYGSLVERAAACAIGQGCHAIVFPEIVMAPALQQKLADYLKNARDRGELRLAVAGSGWTDNGNNVCVLLDEFGGIIGRYYKYSPYCDPARTRVERLRNPGEECTIVDVPGLGRILPSICKDLVSREDRYTLELACAFHPQIVCVPALSDSVNGAFGQPLEELAQSYLAIGCVANLCSAVPVRGDGDAPIALTGAPGRKKAGHSHRPDFRSADIRRTSSCMKTCIEANKTGEPHLCVRMVEIDYHASKSYPTPDIRVV